MLDIHITTQEICELNRKDQGFQRRVTQGSELNLLTQEFEQLQKYSDRNDQKLKGNIQHKLLEQHNTDMYQPNAQQKILLRRCNSITTVHGRRQQNIQPTSVRLWRSISDNSFFKELQYSKDVYENLENQTDQLEPNSPPIQLSGPIHEPCRMSNYCSVPAATSGQMTQTQQQPQSQRYLSKENLSVQQKHLELEMSNKSYQGAQQLSYGGERESEEFSSEAQSDVPSTVVMIEESYQQENARKGEAQQRAFVTIPATQLMDAPHYDMLYRAQPLLFKIEESHLAWPDTEKLCQGSQGDGRTLQKQDWETSYQATQDLIQGELADSVIDEQRIAQNMSDTKPRNGIQNNRSCRLAIENVDQEQQRQELEKNNTQFTGQVLQTNQRCSDIGQQQILQEQQLQGQQAQELLKENSWQQQQKGKQLQQNQLIQIQEGVQTQVKEIDKLLQKGQGKEQQLEQMNGQQQDQQKLKQQEKKQQQQSQVKTSQLGLQQEIQQQGIIERKQYDAKNAQVEQGTRQQPDQGQKQEQGQKFKQKAENKLEQGQQQALEQAVKAPGYVVQHQSNSTPTNSPKEHLIQPQASSQQERQNASMQQQMQDTKLQKCGMSNDRMENKGEAGQQRETPKSSTATTTYIAGDPYSLSSREDQDNPDSAFGDIHDARQTNDGPLINNDKAIQSVQRRQIQNNQKGMVDKSGQRQRKYISDTVKRAHEHLDRVKLNLRLDNLNLGILEGDFNEVLQYVIDSESFKAFQDIQGEQDDDGNRVINNTNSISIGQNKDRTKDAKSGHPVIMETQVTREKISQLNLKNYTGPLGIACLQSDLGSIPEMGEESQNAQRTQHQAPAQQNINSTPSGIMPQGLKIGQVLQTPLSDRQLQKQAAGSKAQEENTTNTVNHMNSTQVESVQQKRDLKDGKPDQRQKQDQALDNQSKSDKQGRQLQLPNIKDRYVHGPNSKGTRQATPQQKHQQEPQVQQDSINQFFRNLNTKADLYDVCQDTNSPIIQHKQPGLKSPKKAQNIPVPWRFDQHDHIIPYKKPQSDLDYQAIKKCNRAAIGFLSSSAKKSQAAGRPHQQLNRSIPLINFNLDKKKDQQQGQHQQHVTDARDGMKMRGKGSEAGQDPKERNAKTNVAHNKGAKLQSNRYQKNTDDHNCVEINSKVDRSKKGVVSAYQKSGKSELDYNKDTKENQNIIKRPQQQAYDLRKTNQPRPNNDELNSRHIKLQQNLQFNLNLDQKNKKSNRKYYEKQDCKKQIGQQSEANLQQYNLRHHKLSLDQKLQKRNRKQFLENQPVIKQRNNLANGLDSVQPRHNYELRGIIQHRLTNTVLSDLRYSQGRRMPRFSKKRKCDQVSYNVSLISQTYQRCKARNEGIQQRRGEQAREMIKHQEIADGKRAYPRQFSTRQRIRIPQKQQQENQKDQRELNTSRYNYQRTQQDSNESLYKDEAGAIKSRKTLNKIYFCTRQEIKDQESNKDQVVCNGAQLKTIDIVQQDPNDSQKVASPPTPQKREEIQLEKRNQIQRGLEMNSQDQDITQSTDYDIEIQNKKQKIMEDTKLVQLLEERRQQKVQNRRQLKDQIQQYQQERDRNYRQFQYGELTQYYGSSNPQFHVGIKGQVQIQQVDNSRNLDQQQRHKQDQDQHQKQYPSDTTQAYNKKQNENANRRLRLKLVGRKENNQQNAGHDDKENMTQSTSNIQGDSQQQLIQRPNDLGSLQKGVRMQKLGILNTQPSNQLYLSLNSQLAYDTTGGLVRSFPFSDSNTRM